MTQIRFILKLKDPDSALHALVYSLFAGRCIEQSRVKRSGSLSLSLSVVKILIWSADFSLSTVLPYSMDHGPVAMHCPNTILNLCTEDEPITSPPLQVVLHVYTTTLDYSYTVPPVRTGLYTVALAPAVTGSVFMLRFRLLSAQCAVISNGKCGF